MMKKIQNKKGFTLVELVIVIAILGVLAAIAVPLVSGLITKANIAADESKAQTYTLAIQQAIEQHGLKVDDRLPAYKDIDPSAPATNVTLELSQIFDFADVKIDDNTYKTTQKGYVLQYDATTRTITAVEGGIAITSKTTVLIPGIS